MGPRRLPRRLLAATAIVAAGLGAAACQRDIELDESDPLYAGAVIFNERCGGCHTLDAAGTEGSAIDISDREYTDGPNLNFRPQTLDSVKYAIRNGGYSGAIMPENIVVGDELEVVSRFVAAYAGREASGPRSPASPPEGQ